MYSEGVENLSTGHEDMRKKADALKVSHALSCNLHYSWYVSLTFYELLYKNVCTYIHTYIHMHILGVYSISFNAYHGN